MGTKQPLINEPELTYISIVLGGDAVNCGVTLICDEHPDLIFPE